METYRLKAGKYYIGDPCYVLGIGEHRSWIKILEDSDYFNKPYERDGHTAIAFSTQHGDGGYYDLLGLEYSVDSGMIGAIPAELMEASADNLGHVIDFPKDFDCIREREGILRFGHVIIDTDPDYDESDDELWEDEEEPDQFEEDEDEETIQ